MALRFLTVVLMTVLSRCVMAQSSVPRVVVTSDVACPKCTLSLQRSLRLGSPNGKEGLGGTGRLVARDSRGRYYVVDVNTAPAVVLVYDQTGAYRETIGRRGQGPGEYGAISQLFVLPGDSLRLDDLRNGRYTVLTPNYKVARTSPYPGAHYLSTLLYRDGSAITNKTLRTPAQVGFPLHRIAPNGTVVRSFGVDEPIYRTGMGNVFRRSLAAAGAPDRFHAAQFQAYVVEQWDTAGRKVGEVVRDATWFRPWVTQPPLAPDAPDRQPVLRAVHEDRQGRLWTFTEVAQPDWRRHVHRLPARDGEKGPNWTAEGVTRNTAYDTIVEVIDLASGRLLVSQRFDQVLYRFVADGYVYADGEDDDGNSYVDIWQLVLHHPASRQTQ